MITSKITIIIKSLVDTCQIFDQSENNSLSLQQSIIDLIKAFGTVEIKCVEVHSEENIFSFQEHCREYQKELKCLYCNPSSSVFLGFNPTTNQYCLIDCLTLLYFPSVFVGYQLLHDFYCPNLVENIYEIYADLSSNHIDIKCFGELISIYKSKRDIAVGEEFVSKYSEFIPSKLDHPYRTEEMISKKSGWMKFTEFMRISGMKNKHDWPELLSLIDELSTWIEEDQSNSEQIYKMDFSYDRLQEVFENSDFVPLASKEIKLGFSFYMV
ncbi:MAG: hypothetical protein ACRCXZ_02220 [Patescibacteria group bacterium]